MSGMTYVVLKRFIRTNDRPHSKEVYQLMLRVERQELRTGTPAMNLLVNLLIELSETGKVVL